MSTQKLSLSRMESQLAKVSRESTTVQKDEWEQFLSWAKRARDGLVEFEHMRKTLDDIIHEFIGVPIAQQDEAWKEKLCDLVVKADERFFATDSIRTDLLLSELGE